MSDRMTLQALLDEQERAADRIGLPGDIFTHTKRGDYYIFHGCSIREHDLVVQADYSPVNCPGLKFRRPVHEFRQGYVRVPVTSPG